jgi:hypothetical protein
MRTSRLVVSFAAVAIAASACSGSSASPSAATAATQTTAASPTAAANTLTVAYEENCQIELIAPSGQRILIDVADASLLTSPAKATDILLSTHTHSDHYSDTFASTFPGKKVTNEVIDTTIDGVKIKSIAASHDDNPVVADASNHIFVIEFNGFKIVHGGSTGQMKLTPEQLAAIGTNVDIAALVLANVGGLDPDQNKAIEIVKQVNPKVLIPTHTALQYVQDASKLWKGEYTQNPTVKIPHDQLPDKTVVLFMGNLALSYGAILNAPESKW